MSTLPSFEVHTLPRSLVVDPPMTNAELEAFCIENDWVRVERTREGVIRMNPPTGGETSSAGEITGRLFAWWSEHERGIIADSSGGFYLPDGSMLSPDAAYVSPETEKRIPKG